MAVIKVNSENFESVKKSDAPVLLDFYADWCGPCRMVAPVLDEIAAERSDITVGKINVDHEPALAGAFGVVSIPTLVVLSGGVVVSRAVGERSKSAILDMLK